MTQTREDAISRLRLMADGNPKWDLSDNDRAAIKILLEENEKLRVALREASDHLKRHGMLAPPTAARYVEILESARRDPQEDPHAR